MMPLTKEEHNEHLEKLLNPDLDHVERTNVLQVLREDYGTFHSDFDTVKTEKEKAEQSRLDLLEANSQLFRKLGSTGDPQTQKQEETKNFSETITVSAIEKGLV